MKYLELDKVLITLRGAICMLALEKDRDSKTLFTLSAILIIKDIIIASFL